MERSARRTPRAEATAKMLEELAAAPKMLRKAGLRKHLPRKAEPEKPAETEDAGMSDEEYERRKALGA